MTAAKKTGEKYSILLIDPSTALRTPVQKLDFLTLATHGREAGEKIADPSRNFAAIVINPTISSPGAIPLIRAAHRYRPGTPIFALSGEKPHFGQEQINRLALAGNFKLPKRLEDLKAIVSKEIMAFTPILKYPRIELLRSQPDPMGPEDAAYVAAPASDFLSGIASPFDVYVRLQSGRYLKVSKALSVFEPARVLVYLYNGVTHFYLAKSSHRSCLTYCDLMARFLINHSGVSPDIKLSHIFNLGQKLTESIRDQGLRDEHIDFAYDFVRETHSLFRKINLGKDISVRSFLDEVSLSEHSIGTAMVASLLTLPLHIETRWGFQTVGIAALFHDVGLHLKGGKFAVDLVSLQFEPTALQFEPGPHPSEDMSGMNEQELNEFQKHPKLGAQFMAGFEAIDEAAIVAIEKHHQRRNNSGFPKVDQSNELNRIAEIIGIADEFVRLVTSNRSTKEVFREMTENIFDGFSFPVIEAFRQVFMPSKRKTAPRSKDD